MNDKRQRQGGKTPASEGLSGDDARGAYVREVTETTRVYIRELQSDNERLRTRLSSAEQERARLVEQLATVRRELDEVQRKFEAPVPSEDISDEDRQLLDDRYILLEEKNVHLANLYVASYRLHETLERRDLLDIVHEIIINLIGSEQFGVFELEQDRLVLLSSMGIDSAKYGRWSFAGDATVAKVVREGEPFHAEGDTNGGPLACVPLRLAGHVIGAIVVFGLLPQKARLEALDRELFDLLATHAGMALYCTKLHAQVSAARRHDG